MILTVELILRLIVLRTGKPHLILACSTALLTACFLVSCIGLVDEVPDLKVACSQTLRWSRRGQPQGNIWIARLYASRLSVEVAIVFPVNHTDHL